MIYKGTGRFTNYNQIWNQFPNNEQCMGDYYYTENAGAEFQINNTNYMIWTNLSMDDGNPFHQNINKYINILVTYQYTSTVYIFNCVFSFNAQQIINPEYNSIGILFKNNLTVGSKMFYSVYVLEQKKGISGGDENIKYVYYTINNGVVGFKTYEGQTWYLSN